MSRDKLIGSWDLVESRFFDEAGNMSSPFSAETTGLLIYSDSDQMSAAVNFVKPDGTKQAMFYAGPLEIHDGYNVHRIAFSNRDDLVGTHQKRLVTFDGEHLVLTNSDSIVGGPGVRAEMIWRRHTHSDG